MEDFNGEAKKFLINFINDQVLNQFVQIGILHYLQIGIVQNFQIGKVDHFTCLKNFLV